MYVGGATDAKARAGLCAIADQHAPAAEPVGGVEAEFVSEVVADEHRGAAGEGAVLHQLLDRQALVAAFGHEFHHVVAWLEAITGKLCDFLLREGEHLGAGLRSGAPVQRHAGTLVFDQHAWMLVRQRGRALMQAVQPLGRVLRHGRACSDIAAQFMPVQAGGRQQQGGEQGVQLSEWPAADQCDGAVETLAQQADGLAHFGQ